jgi:hypothetical protein
MKFNIEANPFIFFVWKFYCVLAQRLATTNNPAQGMAINTASTICTSSTVIVTHSSSNPCPLATPHKIYRCGLWLQGTVT